MKIQYILDLIAVYDKQVDKLFTDSDSLKKLREFTKKNKSQVGNLTENQLYDLGEIVLTSNPKNNPAEFKLFRDLNNKILQPIKSKQANPVAIKIFPNVEIPTKAFAFLDVDQTIFYDNANINLELLSKLKKHGITDIYLFTNMSMKELGYIGKRGAPLSRYQIIEILEDEGFKVHGVITPADTGYYKTNNELHPVGQAYDELYKPLYERILADGEKSPTTDAAADINNVVDFHWNCFIWDKASYFSTQKKQIQQGTTQEIEVPRLAVADANGNEQSCASRNELYAVIVALRNAGTQYNIKKEVDDTTTKTITGCYDDNKATMMQLAIEQLTQKHQGYLSLFFADDTKEHLQGAEQAVADFNKGSNQNNQVMITTHLIPRNYVKSQSEAAQNAYDDSIRSFVESSVAPFEMQRLIRAEIERLGKDKDSLYFTHSSRLKITAWEDLIKRLENPAKGQTYQEVIDGWETEVNYISGAGELVARSTMMAAHRNVFFNMFSTVTGIGQTETTKFMAQLKQKFGAYQVANLTAPEEQSEDVFVLK